MLCQFTVNVSYPKANKLNEFFFEISTTKSQGVQTDKVQGKILNLRKTC